MKRTIWLLLLLPFLYAATDWVDDPSTVPVTCGDDTRNSERYRILADFDGDGIDDLALSSPICSFGNAGGQFEVYLRNAQNQYHKIGEFFGHPGAIALEKINRNVRLWTYGRLGGWIGEIGYFEINSAGMSKREGLIIHPGDSGTRMGNAIYEAVFKNSDVQIKVEISVTERGHVRWKDPNQAL